MTSKTKKPRQYKTMEDDEASQLVTDHLTNLATSSATQALDLFVAVRSWETADVEQLPSDLDVARKRAEKAQERADELAKRAGNGKPVDLSASRREHLNALLKEAEGKLVRRKAEADNIDVLGEAINEQLPDGRVIEVNIKHDLALTRARVETIKSMLEEVDAEA